MRIGIFAKTFPRTRLESVLDAVREQGIDCVQFNMSCAGLEPMPPSIPPELPERIAAACRERGITLSAVSGTFNMIDRDREAREEGLLRLEVLAEACGAMGTSIITLCTGSYSLKSMWHHHPFNSTAMAYRTLCGSMETAVRIAEKHRITLAIEPELSNVIDSARQARRLLNDFDSPRLKVVLDPANLFPAGTLPRMRETLEEAFDLLGGEVVLAHAKDIGADGAAGHEAAGTGLLDYDLYVRLLRAAGYDGPLILHSLREEQVPGCVAFLRGRLAADA